MRRLLLVAFHFPPLIGSSGIQRTLRFAQYLPEFGWNPTVLTVGSHAYESTDPSTLGLIPDGCEVVRVPCLDARRHLSIAGRYPRFVADPDRWASWSILGSSIGAQVCKKRGIDAVWSSYPIASAHRVASAISRRARLPWIADFRDPMAQPGYPDDAVIWNSFRRIEKDAAENASALVFVTESAMNTFRRQFASTDSTRFHLIENGFDEATFLKTSSPSQRSPPSTPLVLLHSGIVYPSERDPTALFDAIASLDRKGLIRPADFRIRFRAAVHDGLLRSLSSSRSVSDYIEIVPPIGYSEAIEEMMSVDGLVMLQGDNCNEQIPAKLYEYLRAGRPILGLADPAGDTGRRLIQLGFPDVAKLESSAEIEVTLLRFLSSVRSGQAFTLASESVTQFSRRAGAQRLAEILESHIAYSPRYA